MSLEVTCGKCGDIIHIMRILKPVKDSLKTTNNKCPTCGQNLSTSDFDISIKRI